MDDPPQNTPSNPTAPLGPAPGPLGGDARAGKFMFLVSLPGGAPPMPTGNLQVTVQDDATGAGVPGVAVTATSPSGKQTGNTDGNGQFLFTSLQPDVYSVSAAAQNFTPATANGISVAPGAGSGGTPAATALLKMTAITVTLNAPVTVACPGHPLELDATATPAGGTFQWTSIPSGILTDAGGVNPPPSGGQAFVTIFKPDNQNGNLPAQSVSVTVLYTLNGGTGSATLTINLHGISFNVANLTVTPHAVTAQETSASVTLGGDVGSSNIISANPTVQIQLDSTCPRQGDCASNYRVGWLQTVRSNTRTKRWSQSSSQTTVTTPIRDAITKGNGMSTLVPFYSVTQTFGGNNDQQPAPHFDSPKHEAQSVDPTTFSPPPDKRLRNASMQNAFTAWLVVQSEEVESRAANQGYVFLRNFDWSVDLTVQVDVSKPVGQRCTPQSSNPTVQAVGTGQGSNTPVFTQPVFNNSLIENVNPAFEIP